jgi:hypothetical protein
MTIPPPPRPQAPPPNMGGQLLALAGSRRRTRCARATLLWFIAFFVLAQVALDLFLLVWHPTLQDNFQTYKLRRIRELAAGEPERPLLVMLGSSRTQHAFQAGLLNGLPGPGGKPLLAYNLGVPTSGQIHACLYLRDMLEGGVRPRLLLVEFSPMLLNEPREGVYSEEGWTLGPWLSLPQLAHCWPYFARPADKAVEWLRARLVPWYILRSEILDADRQQACRRGRIHAEQGHDPWGFLHHTIAFNPQQREFCVSLNACSWRPTLSKFRVGPGPLRAMRDLLETARRQRIPVVLVLMPESNAFRSWYSPPDLAEALRLFSELRDAYATEAIDAYRWLPDEDFNDGHHVDEKGARAFTMRLIEELRPILARLGEATPSSEPATVAATGGQ